MLDFKGKIKDKLSSAESDGLNLNNYEEKLREFAKTRQEYAELVAVRGLSSSQPLLELMEMLGSGTDIKKSLGKDTGKIDVLSKQVEKDNQAVHRFIEELRIENDKRKKELSEASKRITTLEKEIQQTDNLEERLKEFLERKVEVAGIEPQLIQNWEEKRQREKQGKRTKRIIAIVFACFAFLIVLTTVIIPVVNRNKAYDIYGGVLNTAKVGDTITFGKYEQDNNTSNGKEDIEWIVLAKENEKVLVISKYALDCKKYNMIYTEVTWKDCFLRKWLNRSFMNDAFDSSEKEIIAKETISAESVTTDKVFLLSIAEAEKYFTTDESRRCAPTAYAIARSPYTVVGGPKTASGEATCSWWLRLRECRQDKVSLVSQYGKVYWFDNKDLTTYSCVRPAMWINLGP